MTVKEMFKIYKGNYIVINNGDDNIYIHTIRTIQNEGNEFLDKKIKSISISNTRLIEITI